jgi:hypothetical protein
MFNGELSDNHDKFRELAALAQKEALTDDEALELKAHLHSCDPCRQAYEEYSLISTEGMDFLAVTYGFSHESRGWDARPTFQKLLARLRVPEKFQVVGNGSRPGSANKVFLPGNLRWATAGVAACLLIIVALSAYKLGRQAVAIRPLEISASTGTLNITTEKKAADELVSSQNAQLSRLQIQVSSEQQEIARLRDALHTADAHSVALAAANSASDEKYRELTEQRDKLASQLRDAEQSYQLVQAELTTLRAEHERVVLHTASLESKIDELSTSTRDQDRRLRDDEQYLASDRDIRELMGARKLYIADVFDVDSGSRTRKPFGRVFYTESKSLIFYAFDLDHQPGVKNASAFQVWGQSDAESGEKTHATNLGILYMDSESNRRWVLHLDDPKQLAEIDAVFVTVEPQGGSQKPTGKPFLYALLHREANHP